MKTEQEKSESAKTGSDRTLRRLIQLKPMKIISILISLAVIGFPVMPVNAADDTLIKKATFTANELDFHYDFPEEIEENGQKYSRGFVSYMVLDETHETQTVHETDAETIKDLYTKKYDISKSETLDGIPKEKVITVDSKEYTLQLEDIKYESVPILHRTADVSTTIKLTEDEIKESIIYRYTDEDTGRNVNVILPKKSVSETDEAMENSISFPVTFHRYGSEEYIINNKKIPISNGDLPLDKKYFPDVKAESDYADTDGEITALVWDGDSYISGGEVCRNAVATLTERQMIYEITYSDTVELPDADGYWAILCYGGDCVEYTGKVTYKVEATAEYYPVNEKPVIQPLFIGIGIAVLALTIAVVLFIIAKKKKKSETYV